MAGSESIIFSFFLIFSGAALLATFALFTRQPLLVAYIVLGALLGPFGIKLINDTSLLKDFSNIGIIFLLFLLGLDLRPKNLLHTFKKATVVELLSSLIFAGVGFSIAYFCGFSLMEALFIGIAMTFSSTIIGIKLLPTTVLHHKYTGEIVVSLLLLQDLMAIIVLIFIYSAERNDLSFRSISWVILSLPLLVGFAFGFVRFILLPLLEKFDKYHEYIFLIAIGWCLGVAELAETLGLSLEIGAFIAGISIASSPISQYIANNLKPLRDFFLILFFFSLGASFDLSLLSSIWIPSIILAAAMLILKPLVYSRLLITMKEEKNMAWEIGWRLGQNSEFSLLIAYVASSAALIGYEASHVIQATAIMTFIISSYLVVFRYPTPIAVSDELRRD
ncbi:MAG: cation:proton antiporter [Pseudomonadales bacterium]|nr:cation:proton antiporter [Pseudomonadales bacterium]